MRLVVAAWVVLAAGSAVAQPAKPTLAVSIVARRSAEAATISLGAQGAHFDVIITNVSAGPQRVWREWCSWGYSALSFEVTLPNGQTQTVAKKPNVWDRNFPDETQLRPGEHQVFEVTFRPDVWLNAPLPKRGGQLTVQMKAIYQVAPDRESAAMKVWTGRVESPLERFTIYN